MQMRDHSWSPIAFAHRGGLAHHPENTLAAFRHALASEVTGIETDAWVTADGVTVLHHDGEWRPKWSWRRRRIFAIDQADLPADVPTIDELYALTGDRVSVQVDCKGPGSAAAGVVDAARRVGGNALAKLWLAHDGADTSDWRVVAEWRSLDPAIHLLDSTRRHRLDLPVEQYARRAAEAGIEGINMPGDDWQADAIGAVHQAGLRAFAFNVQQPDAMTTLLRWGIDALYSDHVDRLTSAFADLARLRPPAD